MQSVSIDRGKLTFKAAKESLVNEIDQSSGQVESSHGEVGCEARPCIIIVL
jgi:hypothetical protein